jgi:methyltransferase (TIGR00027 family)
VPGASSPIRGVADTARWVALYRAIETERPDAIFRDPHARRLAGPRGQQILDAMPQATRAAWAFVARTWLFDLFIRRQVDAGVTLVVNLAAGLDTRPYRMPLPPGLHWVEVDQSQLLDEKTALLADSRPVCSLERVAMDLTDEGARRELFRRLGQAAGNALVITEGLLAYLDEAQVGRLADDLAAQPAFRSWVLDLMTPRLQRIIGKQWGRSLEEGGAPLLFAPESGPDFFAAHGWRPADVRSSLVTAARLKRLPLLLRLLARLPAAGRFHPRRPWSGVGLFTRASPPLSYQLARSGTAP